MFILEDTSNTRGAVFRASRDSIDPSMTHNSTTRPFYTCTEVTPACPVTATTLGYYPNLGASYFFLVAFAICFFASTAVSIRKRTWMFMVAVSSGLALEVIGKATGLQTPGEIPS